MQRELDQLGEQIVEVVEDEHGMPLSAGRKRRTIAGSLKRALRKRDGTCTFPGCTHRIFLEDHHIRHWADGGETSLANALLLCSVHHRHVRHQQRHLRGHHLRLVGMPAQRRYADLADRVPAGGEPGGERRRRRLGAVGRRGPERDAQLVQLGGLAERSERVAGDVAVALALLPRGREAGVVDDARDGDRPRRTMRGLHEQRRIATGAEQADRAALEQHRAGRRRPGARLAAEHVELQRAEVLDDEQLQRLPGAGGPHARGTVTVRVRGLATVRCRGVTAVGVRGITAVSAGGVAAVQVQEAAVHAVHAGAVVRARHSISATRRRRAHDDRAAALGGGDAGASPDGGDGGGGDVAVAVELERGVGGAAGEVARRDLAAQHRAGAEHGAEADEADREREDHGDQAAAHGAQIAEQLAPADAARASHGRPAGPGARRRPGGRRRA